MSRITGVFFVEVDEFTVLAGFSRQETVANIGVPA